MEPHRTSDPLVVAFYLIARDVCPAGELTRCVNMTREFQEYQLTNPHLAAFAEDLAARIRSDDKRRFKGPLLRVDPAESLPAWPGEPELPTI